jgi:hypothetical protein
MKNIVLLIALTIQIQSIYSQEVTQESPPVSPWKKVGTFSFLVNQSSFDNWIAGGVSNISGAIGVNYDFNYSKANWSWDNKIIVAFGITKIKALDIQKSNDRLEWNSVLGKKAKGIWNYSLFLNFKTQFTDDLNSETKGPTRILSPGYLQVGPGILWKKSDDLKVNISVATLKLIVVDKELTLPDDAYFGVEEGSSVRYELGASIGAYYKFTLMENITMENILNMYSDYLEDPQNVDFDYTINIVMGINKYFSTNLAFQAIYDDNAFQGLQTRQMIGLGINYSF